MNKLLRFFRKKKRAVKAGPAEADCAVDEPAPVNGHVYEKQRAADKEVTERYKTLRGLGPFLK
jgi:hypothetical protein